MLPRPIHVTANTNLLLNLLMEERHVKRLVWLSIGLLFGIFGLSGCQGTGNTVNFDPQALKLRGQTKTSGAPGSLIVQVKPFQDQRAQKMRVGSRTHFWGGVTHFNVWNGQLGEEMANLAVDYLQQNNWQASRLASEGNAADVILSGDILAFDTNAKSGFGFTDIHVTIKVRFEAENLSDRSTVRMVLGANGKDTVTVFDPKDVEHLTNVVAKDLFNQLFQDLAVHNKTLRTNPKES